MINLVKDIFLFKKMIISRILRHRDIVVCMLYINIIVIRLIHIIGTCYAKFASGNLHDFAAISGMAYAEEMDVFSDYIVTFLMNKTDVPFVLPICGLYNYSRNNHSMMNIPISSKIAICFANKSYSENIIHDDGAVTFFEEYDYKNIKIMNGAAFIAQIKRDWGYVVCPERNELDRLVVEYCSK